jgi:hypothetical protein
MNFAIIHATCKITSDFRLQAGLLAWNHRFYMPSRFPSGSISKGIFFKILFEL